MTTFISKEHTDKLYDVCVKYQVTEKNEAGGVRITPLFTPILISNYKQEGNISFAVIKSINQYCPEASVIEKGVIYAIICTLLRDHSKQVRETLDREIESNDNNPAFEKDVKAYSEKNAIKKLDEIIDRLDADEAAK